MKIKVALMCLLSSAALIAGPCDGENALLSLIDRPTIAFSACVAPPKSLLLESGYIVQENNGIGEGGILPQAEFRAGIGFDTEFDILAPNFVYQNIEPSSGFGSTTLLLKKMLYENERFIVSLQGALNPPGGSEAFGTVGYQGFGNLIFIYTLTEKLSIAGMLGAYSQTAEQEIGYERFMSFSPDLVVSLNITPELVGYFEAYASTKVSPTSGFGSNMDVGLMWLVRQNISLDLSYSHRLSGELLGLNQYINIGGVIRFN